MLQLVKVLDSMLMLVWLYTTSMAPPRLSALHLAKVLDSTRTSELYVKNLRLPPYFELHVVKVFDFKLSLELYRTM